MLVYFVNSDYSSFLRFTGFMMTKCGINIIVLGFATTLVSTTKVVNNPLVDALIIKLKQATWDEDEATCLRTTLEMLYGVKNKTFWAVWAWDAMQPPVGALYATTGHLGNYDQCLKAPWSFDQGPLLQYCLVDVENGPNQPYRELGPYDNVEDYLKIKTRYGRPLNKQTFGICLPSSCRPDSISKVYRLMHQLSYLTEGNVTVDPRDCRVAGEHEPKTIGFILFWTFIASLAIMVAVSTYYFTNIHHRNKTLESILRPFCLKANIAELVKQSDDDIKVMNGMRFLSAVIVVLIHEAVIMTMVPISNKMEMDQMEHSFLGQIFLHAEIVVDTFFTMSGLLVAKALFSGKNKNLLLWLVKRYIRLIGPFAIMTFFILSSVYHIGDGPFWKRGFSLELDMCKIYWWKNFFMINNDVRTVCVAVSWSISCDFQLAVLGVFMFYLYKRNKRIGLSVFFATGVLCTARIAWVTYSQKLPLLPFESFLIFMDVRNHTLINDVYFSLESRVTSYFIGMCIGYILTMYKPRNYRNIINKKWSTIILATSLIFLTVTICLKCIYDPPTYNPIEVAILVALNRSVWVIGICGIIFVSEYGRQNIITDLLNLSIFGPLSKLSYGMYMIHFIIIQRNKLSSRNLATYDLIASFTDGFGVVIMSCFASLIMYILIEAPLIRISNDLFMEKKIESSYYTNGAEARHTHQNGNSKSKIS